MSDIADIFVPTYSRSGAPFVKGKGMYLFDSKGKKFLDFGAGIAVSALGHSHPAIVKALIENGSKLLHTSNLYYNKPNLDFAKALHKIVFPGRIFLCNSGTEANEAAIKFSRKWASLVDKEKFHILSFSEGFHGRTYGAMSATAQPKFHAGFLPILEGCHYAEFNNIADTENLLKQYKYAAIIVEPFQGEGGVNPAATEFLQFLRKYATENSIGLVFDEIQCGMARTGTLWNYQQHGVVPDIMTLAKPIGGGLPLGAVVCREDIALSIKPGDHGTTFGGNPLACALGVEMIKIVSKKSFINAVKEKGIYLKEKLNALAVKYPIIKEVRGSGLLVGAEVSVDPMAIITGCRDKGLLVLKAEKHTVRFAPPLIVTEKEIDLALGIFSSVLEEIKG